MTDNNKTPVRSGTSYLEWAPIAAGAVAALALSSVLLTAGAAIGLSLVSPYANESFGKWAATLATGWALAATIGSFLVGGYIAGRFRLTWNEGNPDEVIFRDGTHGFLVWSLSIAAALLLTSTPANKSALLGGASQPLSYVAGSSSSLPSQIDVLLRSPAIPLPAGWQPANTAVSEEIARVLVIAAGQHQLTSVNRTYLAQIVTSQTGIAATEAEKRVDVAYADFALSIDQARRALVLVGLVTTTALLFGLAAAWYAGQRGGHHRDNNIPAKFGAFRRPRVSIVAYNLDEVKNGS